MANAKMTVLMSPVAAVRRQLNRIEALVCFALSYAVEGWLSVFWSVYGLSTLFGLWDRFGLWEQRRREQREQAKEPAK